MPDASLFNRNRRRRSDRRYVAGDPPAAAGSRIIGVEPVGSPTLHASLAAGHVVRLPEVTTKVATKACGRTDEGVYDLVRANVDEVVLIEDFDMQRAAELLWFECGIAADLSGAGSLAALMSGAVVPPAGCRIAGLSAAPAPTAWRGDAANGNL